MVIFAFITMRNAVSLKLYVNAFVDRCAVFLTQSFVAYIKKTVYKRRNWPEPG
jgi:hypothetical protein